MSNVLSRRVFAAGGLASAASLATRGSIVSADTAEKTAAGKPSGWIDAHVHVWTPDTERYPLDLKQYSVEDMKPSSFTPDQLFSQCRPSGVDRVVLIQMSFYNHDNQYMLDMIKAYPGVFSGVGIVDHQAADLVAQMKKLASQGVRGFRIRGRADEVGAWQREPGMAKLWSAAAENDLSVCPLINPADLKMIDQLCTMYPDTRVVIDHFGRVGITGEVVPAELDDLCRLARHRNVHVKTSAFYALGRKKPPYKDLRPMIRRVVDAFSPQRLMWASDCPFQVQGIHDYDSSIALIRDHMGSLSQADREWMLRGTAEKVFFNEPS